MSSVLNNLDIAVPLFNEEESVENLYNEILPILMALKDREIESKLLLVNDGSSDKTLEKLEEFFANVPNAKIINHRKNENLGGFLRTVQKEMKSEFVVFLDSDCTFDPKLILDMVDIRLDGVDGINGSPYHPKGVIDG